MRSAASIANLDGLKKFHNWTAVSSARHDKLISPRPKADRVRAFWLQSGIDRQRDAELAQSARSVTVSNLHKFRAEREDWR
jgi:hypothetical protein